MNRISSNGFCTHVHQYDMDPEGDQPPVACGRSLTEEEAEKLRADITLVSSFQREKLEREAKRNWDLFYKRNSTHFFKVAVTLPPCVQSTDQFFNFELLVKAILGYASLVI